MDNRRLNLWIAIGVSTILLIGCSKTYGGRSVIATWDLTFKDSASGGSLILARTRNRTVECVSIQTSPSESPESVVRRLAETINWNISRDTKQLQYDRHILWVGGFKAVAEQNTLKLPSWSHTYALAGTETGLGIPEPPLSLSCCYDQKNDQVLLRWINPSSAYDFIIVNSYWTDRDHSTTKQVPGASTRFTIDRAKTPLNVKDMDFQIIGFRENIPSNAAAIHVSGHSQEELYGIPFFDGVAPNWAKWASRPVTGGPKLNAAAFEEQERYPTFQGYNAARALLAKPYYQIIKAPSQGGEHGIYRKFLGLTTGHTYRLTACLSTLEMDSIKGDWSLSLHAIPNGPDGKDLTGQQMAGLAPLPDGRSGPQAGRIAFRGPGNTTKGAFDLVFSGDKNAGDPQSSHITLPAGVDTITVWVRFRCSDPKGKVGFSGVKLEDISAIENPKSPAEVRDEETAEEIRLLKWMEKAAREASGAEPRL